MLDGGMLQSGEGKNKVPARVYVCKSVRVCVIRCEVLGAALCSLKGSGCCPALCSSSTVLHVSHPLPPLIIGPFLPPFLALISSSLFFFTLFLPRTPSSRPSITATKQCFATVVLIDAKGGNKDGEGHLSSLMSI